MNKYANPDDAPKGADGEPPDAWLNTKTRELSEKWRPWYGDESRVPLYRLGNAPVDAEVVRLKKTLNRAESERGELLDGLYDLIHSIRWESDIKTATAKAAKLVDKIEGHNAD